MKRITFILFFVWLGFTAKAKLVEHSAIESFAIQFLTNHNLPGYSISSIEAQKFNNHTTSYLVRIAPEGFIIIAADDKVEPLLAYSFESDAPAENQWPEPFAWWMSKSADNIIARMNDAKATRNYKWDNEAYLKSANATVIAPFINVRWDQGNKYNQFCPDDEKGPGGKVWVGCVAVSMAQAMSKYKFPTNGQGKASYVHKTYGTQTVNFEKETPYEWDSMPPTSANEYNARLLYHCAVTVNMDFGADGSGANTEAAASALKNFFNYSKTTLHVDRPTNDDDWKATLIDNLKNGYPIIYHGDADNGTAGHAWNVDGVDASGLFHMNWGWGGSMNGYYNINNLAPGSNDFTKNHGAIIGIKPKVAGPIDITLDNTAVKEKQPAGTFVSRVRVDDEYPDNPYTYNLKGNPIIIGDGGFAPAKFYIENDSLKTVETFDYQKRQTYTLFIEAVDSMGHSFEKKFEIQVKSTVSVPELKTAESGTKIFPNPFSSVITVENELDVELSIFTLQGKREYTTTIQTGKSQIDLNQLTNGLYLVKVKNVNGIYYQKLEKR